MAGLAVPVHAASMIASTATASTATASTAASALLSASLAKSAGSSATAQAAVSASAADAAGNAGVSAGAGAGGGSVAGAGSTSSGGSAGADAGGGSAAGAGASADKAGGHGALQGSGQQALSSGRFAVSGVVVQIGAVARGDVRVSALTRGQVSAFIPAGELFTAGVTVRFSSPLVASLQVLIESPRFTSATALYRLTSAGLVYVPAMERRGEYKVRVPKGTESAAWVALAPKKRDIPGATSPVTGIPVLPEAGAGTGLTALGAGLMLWGRKRAL